MALPSSTMSSTSDTSPEIGIAMSIRAASSGMESPTAPSIAAMTLSVTAALSSAPPTASPVSASQTV